MAKKESVQKQIEYNRLYRAKNNLVVALISKETKDEILKHGEGRTINEKIKHIVNHFLGRY